MKSRICILILATSALAALHGCHDEDEPLPQYKLEIDIQGKGVITLAPPGGTYDSGTTVTVTTLPDPGWCLHHWSFDALKETAEIGVNTGTIYVEQPCLDGLTHEVKITEDIRVLAVFMEQSAGNPEIVFDEIPAWGTTDNLKGHVLHVSPADYRVAVAIYTSGFFNKPTWAQKTVIIRADGTWTADITTGTDDQHATKIFAALVPKEYEPPTLNNIQVLPAELLANAVAFCQVRRTESNNIINVFRLSVKTEGEGDITLDPAGGEYDEGSTVTLTATPGPGWRFDHYASDVEGTQNQTTVVMNKNKAVTAVFTESIPQYSLEVSVEGEGVVTLDPLGGLYEAGTQVTLTALPGKDWCLQKWLVNTTKQDTDPGGNVGPIYAGGVCLNDLTKKIEMTGNQHVKAVFQYEVPGGPGDPEILFDEVPAWGTKGDLKGRVLHVPSADYRVAIAIYTSGWFNKPYWTQKTIFIRADGSWTADITTGTNDEYATRIFAALVTKDYIPPTLNSASAIPKELLDNALATCQVERDSESLTRVIHFSGYEWYVRQNAQPEGPPSADDGLPDPGNYFSDSEESVWVDAQGRLHLAIRSESGLWKCAEVVCAPSLGYGTYTFTVTTNPADIDHNAVAGFFLWSNDPTYHHREIDIEFARWGIHDGLNVQYVVQPWYSDGHRLQFDYDTGGITSVHAFTWVPESVLFTSEYEESAPHFWEFTGPGIPVPGDEQPRINLWLSGGYITPPSDGQTVELIIESFTFSKA